MAAANPRPDTLSSGGSDGKYTLNNVPIDCSQHDLIRIPLTTEIRRSKTISGGYTCALHEFFDYGPFRFHVLLSDTDETPPCVEKTLLAAINCDIENDAREGREKAWRDLEELWYPFVKADCISRSRNVQPPPQDGGGTGEKQIIKLQIATVDGKLSAMEHTEHIKWPRHDPLPNVWPTLKVFSHRCINIGPKTNGRLGHQVQIDGRDYHFKSLQNFFDTGYFVRLVNDLLKLHGRREFPILMGLAESETGGGNIDGMVRGYMEGVFLDEIDPSAYSTPIKEKWKRQICDAVRIMESVHVRWDACPGDVFIRKDEDEEGNIVICGIGGGFLAGSSPDHVSGSQAGKIKGLGELWNYIDGGRQATKSPSIGKC
ncbi:hypothetical protein K440DRAFT_637995 [Wilcoxina mikolae CBS 423.85]|nr:hypothetical protein K440DRAFT_637995 [Wilcoxina mikolae CBS 423.85]